MGTKFDFIMSQEYNEIYPFFFPTRQLSVNKSRIPYKTT